MNKEAIRTDFLALSALYLKMTEQTEKIITDDEINLLISSADKSNLSKAGCNQMYQSSYNLYTSGLGTPATGEYSDTGTDTVCSYR